MHHTGSTLRPRTVAEKAAIARGIEERVWPLIVAGKIKPVIDSTYPMAKAGEFLRWILSSHSWRLTESASAISYPTAIWCAAQ